jgi:hypothetical protein
MLTRTNSTLTFISTSDSLFPISAPPAEESEA